MAVRLVALCALLVGVSAKVCALDSNALLEQAKAAIQEGRPVDPSAFPAPGPYKTIETATIKNVPGLTMGMPHSAALIYPKEAVSNGTVLPFLSFAHGTLVGSTLPPVLTSYGELLHVVASYGFIIGAPESCPAIECGTGYSKDQLATITSLKEHTNLHPALKAANFSKVGIFGHSMGAMATLGSAGGMAGSRPSTHNIVAGVAMHMCWDVEQIPAEVSVPLLLTAGSADTICEDGCAYNAYNAIKRNAVYFDIAGASHLEPTDAGKNWEDKAVGLYLSCHVRGENCDQVLNKNICGQLPVGVHASACLEK